MSKRWKIRKRNAARREQHEARLENNRIRTDASFVRLIEQIKVMTPQTNENPTPPCDHLWEHVDASFDHEFGTEQIHYEECSLCGEQRPCQPSTFELDDDPPLD